MGAGTIWNASTVSAQCWVSEKIYLFLHIKVQFPDKIRNYKYLIGKSHLIGFVSQKYGPRSFSTGIKYFVREELLL